jgi:hypothetical protein
MRTIAALLRDHVGLYVAVAIVLVAVLIGSLLPQLRTTECVLTDDLPFTPPEGHVATTPDGTCFTSIPGWKVDR